VKNTLTKKSINNLFDKGKWITTNNISAVYLPSDSFKYMVTAPIKTHRKAVDRNKIKRLLRKGISEISEVNIDIAFIYKNKDIVDYKIIKNNVKEIYNKIKI
jgi:ribonuclease P protein component